MKLGDIVISKMGHDAGKTFIVVASVSDKFVLIADGKSRTMQSPKLKRIRHLRTVAESGVKSPTNAALKRVIKNFNSERRLYAEK